MSILYPIQSEQNAEYLANRYLISLLTLQGLIILVIVMMVFTFIGYKLHKLLHSCKNPLSSIRSRYKYWSRHLFGIKTELNTLQSRLKLTNKLIIIFTILLASFIVFVLYFTQSKNYPRSVKYGITGIISVIILLFVYKWYASYRMKKLNQRKVEYEAKKTATVNNVLKEFTPEMQVNYRKSVTMESQAKLENQAIRLKILEKEINMYTNDLKEKKELLNQLEEFKWCDYCNGKLEHKESLLFKCPNECLNKYFTETKQLSEELKLLESSINEFND